MNPIRVPKLNPIGFSVEAVITIIVIIAVILVGRFLIGLSKSYEKSKANKFRFKKKRKKVN